MQKNNRLQKAKLLVGDNEVITASPYTLRRYMARNHSYNGDVDGKLHTINGREYVQNASGMLFPLSRTSIPYSGTGKLPSVGYRRGDPINTTRYRGVKADGVVVRSPAKNATTSMRTTSGASSPTTLTPEESNVLDLINQNAKNGNFIDTRRYRGMRTNQSIIRPATRNRIAPEESNTLLNNLLNQPLKGSASSIVGSPPTSSMGRAVRGATNSAVRSTIGSEIERKVKPRIIPTVESGVERASRSGLGRKTMRIAGKVWGKLPWWAKLGVGIAGGIGGAYAVDQTVGRILPRKQQASPPTPTAELGKRMSKSMTKSMTTPKIAIKHNNKYL